MIFKNMVCLHTLYTFFFSEYVMVLLFMGFILSAGSKWKTAFISLLQKDDLLFCGLQLIFGILRNMVHIKLEPALPEQTPDKNPDHAHQQLLFVTPWKCVCMKILDN